MEREMEGKRIQFECWNFVDLNSKKFESVERWMEKMQSFGQISCVTLYAKLACQQQRLLLIDR